MRKLTLLFAFLGFYCTILPIFGQETLLLGDAEPSLSDWQESSLPSWQEQTLPDWQEQILQQVDTDDLGEEAYQELLEELSELVLWTDTLSHHSLLPHKFSQQLILSSNSTLNPRDGYRDRTAERQDASKAYLGDSWHHTIRYRLRAGSSWQAGFCLDKDAGEPWRKQFPHFDSAHGFIAYQSPHSSRLKKAERILQQAIIGHYRMRLGCGLLLSQGFTLGKQYMTQQLQQRSNIFRPYASASESGYMQGMALKLNLGHRLTLLPYVSALQIDGTLSGSILSAIRTDGMHRTRGEADKRNAAWQSIFGARLGWQGEWYDLGLHLLTTHLQYDYIRSQNYYNQDLFSGHQLSQVSVDYQARALGAVLKGEMAVDDHGGLAAIHTVQGSIGRYWSASFTHRYFGPQYRQLHASTLHEGSTMQGEQGLTLNAQGSLTRSWSALLMADWFMFSKPQYGIRANSSQGAEGLARATYTNHSHVFSVAYHIKYKGDCIRHSTDATLSVQPWRHFSLRSQAKGRIYSSREQNPSYGYAFSQSITWSGELTSDRQPFSLCAQAAYFSTDDYDSRLYLTEKSVLYGFGLPMLYGRGLRYSLTGQLHISPRCILECKWALSNYADRSTISSGLQLIQGNSQHDLWLQLRFKI